MTSELDRPHRIPVSWEEYESLGPEVRGEYVDGHLVMSPLPTGRHQDICVFDETDDDKRLLDTPHLAVEVLSTDRAADLVRKFGRYAAAGLPRYWIIDPEGPDLIVFELKDHGFVERAEYGPDDVAELDFGPGTITVRPRDLLN